MRVLAVLAAVCLAWGATQARAGSLPEEGGRLPRLVFQAPALPADAGTLGVEGKKTFTLADLGAKVIVLEVIGVYCSQCARQAPLFNNLAKRLNRGSLKGKAVMLALAAGATPQEAALLRSGGSYAYPVVTDQDYGLHKLLGEPKTPFTMLVTPDGEVLYTHLGFDEDVEGLYARIKEAVAGHAP